MILEVAILNIIPEKTVEFEASFEISQSIISSMNGYRGHQLQKCLETRGAIHFARQMGKAGRSYHRIQKIARISAMEKSATSLLFTVSGRRTLYVKI